MPNPDVFEQYPVATWQVGHFEPLAFPVISIQETGANRIVERNRPYRDGAKLDDTGRKATKWSVDAIFENSIDEPGIDPTTDLYPTVMNDLIATFEVHGTGDLTLPTRGKVRARAESYSRSETEGERDYAKVTFTWIEDNEDNVDAQSLEAPDVNTSAQRLTEQTEFTAQSEGTWGLSLADLREFGSELEGIANYPGDMLSELDSKVGIVLSTANSVIRAFTSPRGLELLRDPENSHTQRQLEAVKEMAAQALAVAGGGKPKLTAYRVNADTDLFAIASDIGQYAKDLMNINPGVDPLAVPKGAVIKILDES